MKIRIKLSFLVISAIITACIEDNITSISDSIIINSSYSLPIGIVVYNINDYFESLDTVSIPYPDSVMYNDTIYPNMFHIVDKIDISQFDLGNIGNNPDRIKSITFRLIIENSFPTETRTQIYFTTYQTPGDSLFDNGVEIIPPATLNKDGIVTEPYRKIKDIVIPRNLINNFTSYTDIEVNGYVLTTRSDIGIVKFYPEYEMRIHIGIRIEVEFNLNEI